MLVVGNYDRLHALQYAEKWANSRNPLFYDYTGIGGNCTNFVSQCLFAGSCQMNFTPITGWYYRSPSDRTASWTGVRYLYEFLTTNKGEGPFATETNEEGLETGDVIQLGRDAEGYYHTLLVTGFEGNNYLVSAQSDDALNRSLDTYRYDYARYLHIEGVRYDIGSRDCCFVPLFDGQSILWQGCGGTTAPSAPPPAEATPTEE